MASCESLSCIGTGMELFGFAFGAVEAWLFYRRPGGTADEPGVRLMKNFRDLAAQVPHRQVPMPDKVALGLFLLSGAFLAVVLPLNFVGELGSGSVNAVISAFAGLAGMTGGALVWRQGPILKKVLANFAGCVLTFLSDRLQVLLLAMGGLFGAGVVLQFIAELEMMRAAESNP